MKKEKNHNKIEEKKNEHNVLHKKSQNMNHQAQPASLKPKPSFFKSILFLFLFFFFCRHKSSASLLLFVLFVSFIIIYAIYDNNAPI